MKITDTSVVVTALILGAHGTGRVIEVQPALLGGTWAEIRSASMRDV
jgi:hypothetical protein